MLTEFKTDPPDSVCILRLSAIGDTCNAVPVVRTLQSAWPGTQLCWVIGALEATLVGDIPGVEFITIDKRAGNLAHQLSSLQRRRFDLLLHMHASMRANMVSRHIRARVRLGFDFRRARDFQWLFTNRRIPHRERQHVLEGMLGFTAAAGIEQAQLRWAIPHTEEHRDFAAGLCPAGQRTVIISPCSSQRTRNFRNWPADRYAAIVDYLDSRHGAQVILTGGPTELEKNYATDIAKLASAEVFNLVGQTSLKQLYALIAIADAVICPDSGPAHIGTAAGTPVIGLYASSNPGRTGPYLSQAWVVNRYPEAVEHYLGKPVDQLRWGRRVRDPDVMLLIEVSDVAEKIDRLYASAQATN